MADVSKKHVFSIRLPEDLLIKISDRAQAQGHSRNVEVVDLLRQGLVEVGGLEQSILKFITRKITLEELTKLEAGA